MKKLQFSLFIIFFYVCSLPSFAATSALTLTSGNQELNAGFLWAKDKALSYVATGRPGVPYPCYQGSYPQNPESCLRDITHQVEAGHLLGLDVENFSMLKRFVQYGNNNPDNCRKHWPCWQLLFNGKTSSFTPEIPSPFELAERSFEQYMWTGDNKWITDTEFSKFFQYTNTTLVDYLAPDADGIVSVDPMNLNGCGDGMASYWEFENEKANKAGDALGCQYQSYLGYAKILETNGNFNGANAFRIRAQKLKDEFETNWFIPSANRYASCIMTNGTKKTTWAHEQSLFILLKRITDMGPRTVNYIDFVHSSTYNEGINIETTTYYPEAFYHHNANHIGWHWLLYGLRSRNDYPEVSFLAIRNTICGLMGVSADAPNKKVITLSKLVNDVPWVEVDHIPAGNNDFKVRHDGLTSSTFTNNAGDPLTWEAQFFGEYPTLNVDGIVTTAATKNINGKVVSFVNVPVTVGQSVVVTATTPAIKPNFDYLSDLAWTYTSDATKTRKDVCQSGYAMTLTNPADNSNTTYVKGLGMQNSQEVRYNLNAKYFLFSAVIGLDLGKLGTSDQNGKATFKVLADGVEIYSGLIPSRLERKQIVLNVEGVKELKLITVAQQYTNVYPTWADAKVYSEKTTHFNLSYNGIKNESNPDGQLNPGETADLSFNVANMGYINSGSNTVLTCELLGETATYATVTPTSIPLNAVNANTNSDQVFGITLAANTPKKTSLQFKITVTDGNNTAEFYQTIVTPHPLLELTYDKVEGTQTVWTGNLLEPGNSGSFAFNVKNNGTAISDKIKIVTESKSTFLTITNPTIDVNPIDKGLTNKTNVNFSVAQNTPNNTKMAIKCTLYDKDGSELIGSVEREFVTPSAAYNVSFNSLTNTTNGLSMISAGATSNLVLDVENTGNKPGNAVVLKVNKDGENQDLYSVSSSQFSLQLLPVGAKTTVSVPIIVNASAAKDAVISLSLVADDGTITTTLQKKFVVGSVFCSDMPFVVNYLGYDKVYRDVKVMGSNSISLGKEKTTYIKGLGVHAVNIISFALGGKYTSFKSDVGIDASISQGGSCIFKVYVDNVLAWTSSLLKAGGDFESCNVNVTNAQVLKLEVTDGGDGINSDHADWANARLLGDVTNANPSILFPERVLLIVPSVIKLNDPIRLEIGSITTRRVFITVLNELGKVCYSTYRNITDGTNRVEIFDTKLGKGMYILKITDNENLPEVGKFIIH